MLTRRHLLGQLAIGSIGLVVGLPLHAQPLQRIVAINWAAAETLLVLGVQPIAISDAAYYRRRMATSPLPATVVDIGPFWEPNLELLEQLHPDLILSDQLPPAIEKALNSIAPTEVVKIYPTQTNAYDSAALFMQTLAERMTIAAAAQTCLAANEALFSDLRQRLAANPQPPVCVAVLNQDGRHAAVYGKNSLIQAVLDKLGLVNAWQGPVGAMGNTLVGIERLADSPDARLLYTEIPSTGARLQNLRQTNLLWANLPAVRRGHTFELGHFHPYGGVATAASLARQIGAYLLRSEHA